jgi:hypothetical protein
MWKMAAIIASGRSSPLSNVAEVADGRVGEKTFEVLLGHRKKGTKYKRRESRCSHDPQPIVGSTLRLTRTSSNTPAFVMSAECR